MSAALQFATGLLLPPASAVGWCVVFWWLLRRTGRPAVLFILDGWLGGSAGGAAVAAIGHDWGYATGASVSAAVNLVIRWRRRRKRRGAAVPGGAKARALRDRLVRRAREAARPRPVLRPVLQVIFPADLAGPN